MCTPPLPPAKHVSIAPNFKIPRNNRAYNICHQGAVLVDTLIYNTNKVYMFGARKRRSEDRSAWTLDNLDTKDLQNGRTLGDD